MDEKIEINSKEFRVEHSCDRGGIMRTAADYIGWSKPELARLAAAQFNEFAKLREQLMGKPEDQR